LNMIGRRPHCKATSPRPYLRNPFMTLAPKTRGRDLYNFACHVARAATYCSIPYPSCVRNGLFPPHATDEGNAYRFAPSPSRFHRIQRACWDNHSATHTSTKDLTLPAHCLAGFSAVDCSFLLNPIARVVARQVQVVGFQA